MVFVTWLKQSPFAAPWFDAILFGVLLFEVLPFFLRARRARIGFTAGSLSCQLALLFSCLFLSASLPETMIVLTLVALISGVSSLLEYRLFDRAEIEAECAVKATEAAVIARERAQEFVLPVKPAVPDAETEKTSVSAEPPVSESAERGDDAQ